MERIDRSHESTDASRTDDASGATRRVSRRRALATVTAVGLGGVAGCSSLNPFGSGGPSLLEGFEDGTVAGTYSGDTADPEFSAERATQGDRALRWRSSGMNDGTIDTQAITVERPATMTYDLYLDGGGDAGFLFAVQGSPSGYKAGSKYLVDVRQKTGEVFRVVKYDDGDQEILAEADLDAPFGEFFEVEVDWQDDGTIAATLLDSAGDAVRTVRGRDDAYAAGGIGWRSDDPDFVKYYDDLRLE